MLPIMVMFAKITPKRVEATAFALLTGTSNYTGTMRSFIGTWVNETFVGVTHEDLSKYYILAIISTVGSFAPILYLWLLPTRADIEQKETRDK